MPSLHVGHAITMFVAMTKTTNASSSNLTFGRITSFTRGDILELEFEFMSELEC